MNQISNISNVIKQICEEKDISIDSVISTIELALAAAFRKDFANKLQNIRVEFNLENGSFKVYDTKEVIGDLPEEIIIQALEKAKQKRKASLFVPNDLRRENKREENPAEAHKLNADEESIKFNPRTQIVLSEARKIKKDSKIGEEIETELKVPGNFGRMAAQTAKQVIIQRIREAERETIYQNFKKQEGKMLSGIVQRLEGSTVIVDIGKTAGILPLREQIQDEYYKIGQRIKVIVISVNISSKGPEIILSRANKAMIAELFALEVPEITSGTVEIKAIAREAGLRTKIAVVAQEENIDPIGSCVGQRGTRVQTIINELNGEKIDIIVWDEDPKKFIAAALSPAKVQEVKIIDQENHIAQAIIKEEHQSLAIGKGGQNVRLASRLTGWKIDIMQQELKSATKNLKSSKLGSKDKDDEKEKKHESKKEGKKEELEGKSKKNQKGSILIYTITAIAAMSLPIIYLSSLSIQKLKSSRNIETSIISYYKAESGLEQIMYQTKEDLKNKVALNTNMPQGAKECDENDPAKFQFYDCYNLDIQYSADELNLDLPENRTIQLNLYDLNDSTQDLPALIDRIRLESPLGLNKFEFTAIYWDKSSGIEIKSPVKIIKDGSSNNSLDYIFNDDIANGLKFGDQYLAKIRITAIDPVQLLKITMYEGTNKSLIPGFITLKSVGDEGNTQQSIKVVRAYNATNYFSSASSGLWDFVLFSGSGITK